MAQKHILIICGEPSGELHAANLVKDILRIAPGTKISGVGSLLLRQAGVQIFYDIKGLAVIGLFDTIRKLPAFLSYILQMPALPKPACKLRSEMDLSSPPNHCQSRLN